MGDQEYLEKEFDVGDYLFKEGDTGEEAYLIKSGQIKISKQDGENGFKTLATVGKGNIVGEMALIDGTPRAATAICAEPVTVVVVTNKDEFDYVCWTRLTSSIIIISFCSKMVNSY